MAHWTQGEAHMRSLIGYQSFGLRIPFQERSCTTKALVHPLTARRAQVPVALWTNKELRHHIGAPQQLAQRNEADKHRLKIVWCHEKHLQALKSSEQAVATSVTNQRGSGGWAEPPWAVEGSGQDKAKRQCEASLQSLSKPFLFLILICKQHRMSMSFPSNSCHTQHCAASKALTRGAEGRKSLHNGFPSLPAGPDCSATATVCRKYRRLQRRKSFGTA